MLDFFVQRRDFGYGSGFISPDTTQFYVNIPKSASSFISSWLVSSGWTSATVGCWGTDWNEVDSIIIVMRDPVERWVSGISQFIKGNILDTGGVTKFLNNYTEITENIIISSLDIFDDHVWPQHCFFKSILPNAKRKYVYICPEFEKNLKKELNLVWPIPNIVDYNKSENDKDLRDLKIFFKKRLEKNNNLHNAVKNIYKRDYEIINNNCIV